MTTSANVLKISELWLSWDRISLLKFLEDLAVKEWNAWKHTLYRWLTRLIEKYDQYIDKKDSTITSSWYSTKEPALAQQPDKDILPKKVWLTKWVRSKLENFINIYKNKDSIEVSYFNHLNKVLLYWPPWSWKTTLGFYIAKELKKSIRYVRISDIISYKFWETIKNLSDLFEQSKEEIIFIDEFDAFGKRREDNNDVGELKRIVNALIQILDFQTKSKIVIVATNLVDSIDSAILRRFTFKIEVSELSVEEIAEFLSFLISQESKAIKLTRSELETLWILIKPQTVDSVRMLFEKTMINAFLSGKPNFGFWDYLGTSILEGYLDKKILKEIQVNVPDQYNVLKALIKENYSQKEICELLGIHRNSFKNYFL